MRSSRTAHLIYIVSLFFLIILVAGCLAISAADVIIQALTDRTDTGNFDYRNLIVVGCSYVLLAIASLMFSCSRVLTIRGALQDIPKSYVPIKMKDLPKKMYTRVQAGFDTVQTIRKAAEPLPQEANHNTQSMPSSPTSDSVNFEGIDFKQTLADSPRILEAAVRSVDGELGRKPHVSVRRYVEDLISMQLIKNELGQVYVNGYERARFSNEPISHDEYMEIMRYLALILRGLDYQFHSNHTNSNSLMSSQSSSSSISSRTRSTHTTGQHRRLEDSRDDDVVSLSRSIATWSSRRSASRSHRTPWSPGMQRSESNVETYDDEQMRHMIYQRLMRDRSN